jgi:hypothetical protein
MKQVFRISFFLLLIFGVGVKGNAQTYTFDLSRLGCDGGWNTPACWNKVNLPGGCTNSISLIPNLTGSTGCQVFVEITGNVTFTGNVTLGGTLAKIEVRNGAVFTMTGNVTIQANRAITLDTRTGGSINIQGTSGIALSAGASTLLTIDGDNTGSVNTPRVNFANAATMQVNSGGRLNISGNLTQTAQATGNINIFGGQVNVGGSVLMSNGASATKTTLRIDTRNSGSLNVTSAFNTATTGGNSLVEISGDGSGSVNTGTFNLGDLTSLNLNTGGVVNVSSNFNVNKPNTGTINLNGGEMNINGSLNISTGGSPGSSFGILNISGNGTGKSITTNLISIGNNARLNVLDNGSLIVNGITKYNGSDAQINVSGYFKTLALDIAGGTTLQFNSLGSANVVVETDVTVGGSSSISFGGDSVVEIGGDFIINGTGANVIIGPNADVLVCGEPDVIIEDQVEGCILPVDYMYIESHYSKESNAAILIWATSKEWENSRFEIERSVGGISDFVKVGEVQGMGWKDSITEYEYTDRNLPLTGGNIYYRLKQVDLNGEFSLSKVMSVKVQGVQFTEGVWRAYPNPTENGPFRVSLLDRTQYHGEIITFKIIQPTAISGAVSVASENEMNEAISQMIKNVPKGVFVIEITWGQKIEHIKVLKK